MANLQNMYSSFQLVESTVLEIPLGGEKEIIWSDNIYLSLS